MTLGGISTPPLQWNAFDFKKNENCCRGNYWLTAVSCAIITTTALFFKASNVVCCWLRRYSSCYALGVVALTLHYAKGPS